MDRKLLIGLSSCITILLILYSSSNVWGYQTCKGTIRNGINNQLEDILFKRNGDIIKKVDLLRYPLLFFLVSILARFRLHRGWFMYDISTDTGAFNWVDIKYPLVFLRSCWLIISSYEWLSFWGRVSYLKDWNWPLDYIE